MGRGAPCLVGAQAFQQRGGLAPWFDVRVPTGGDGFTVNVGQFHAHQPKEPFANRHAASMRALYDLSDLEQSRFVYQTGQSGLVFSSRYGDMSKEWAAVAYRPLQLEPGRDGAPAAVAALSSKGSRQVVCSAFAAPAAWRRERKAIHQSSSLTLLATSTPPTSTPCACTCLPESVCGVTPPK